MNAHLGGTVNGDVGADLLTQLQNAQILHDKGVHTAGGGMTDQSDRLGSFLIGNQRIECQMDSDTTNMAIKNQICAPTV